MTKAILITVITVLASCAAKTSLLNKKGAVSSDASSIMFVPITKTVTVTKHDTVKPKHTPVDAQRFLSEQYKQNFNSLFEPEFNKMNTTIGKLADGNKSLSDIITAMRQRAIEHNDSTQRQMKYYIREALSSQARSIQYQQESLQARKDYDKDIRSQTQSNTTLAIICLISIIILAGLYLALWIRVNSIAKKIDNLNRI